MSTIDTRDGTPVDVIQYSNTKQFELAANGDIQITTNGGTEIFTVGVGADMSAFLKAAELAARLWG